MLELDAGEFAANMEQLPAVVLAALKTVSRRLTESQEAAHLLSVASLEQRTAYTPLMLSAEGRRWIAIRDVDALRALRRGEATKPKPRGHGG